MSKGNRPVSKAAALLLTLCAVPVLLASSCAVAAVTLGAVVVGEEFRNNAEVATVPGDTEYVFRSAKSSLAHLTDALLHVDNDYRAIETKVDEAVDTVHVETFDTGNATIRVTAKKLLVYSPEIAKLVMNRIVTDLRR